MTRSSGAAQTFGEFLMIIFFLDTRLHIFTASLAWCVLVGCGKSPSGEPAKSVSHDASDAANDVSDTPTVGTDVAVDSSLDAGKEAISVADNGSLPDSLQDITVAETAPMCKDVRHLGDGKAKDKACWAPPQDYCAVPPPQIVTVACNPDTKQCCEFVSTCIPCGWTDCNKDPGAKICSTQVDTPDACAASQPNGGLQICWDGLSFDKDAGSLDGKDLCEDPHQFGDGKVKDSKCWGPPKNYCAGGASQVITKACDAKSAICCKFKDSCIPCGWVNCFENPSSEACTPAVQSGPICESVQPDEQAVICWDE